MDVYLQLVHSEGFIKWALVHAHPYLDVVSDFTIQCGTEPRPSTIATCAVHCTTFRVPQGVVKVPLPLSEVYGPSVTRLTKVILSNKGRWSNTRIRGRTRTIFYWVFIVFGQSCSKSPNVVSRIPMCNGYAVHVRATDWAGEEIGKAIWGNMLISTNSSTDIGEWNTEGWEVDGAAGATTSAHASGVDSDGTNTRRTEIAVNSHVNISSPHPTSTDASTVGCLHVAKHLYSTSC